MFPHHNAVAHHVDGTKHKLSYFFQQNELTYKFTTIEDLLEDEDQTTLLLNLYSNDHDKNKDESLQIINDELENKVEIGVHS